MSAHAPSRYSAVAIGLHWLIAAALIAMIPLGWWMSDAIADPARQAAAYAAFQLHKSIGLTILGLSLLRLGWRLTHRAPALPAGMNGLERFAAKATHAAFYALMILLPLSGWIYVSTGWMAGQDRPFAVATSWFGLAEVPNLPALSDAPVELRRATAFQVLSAHSLMAWGAIVLIALHVAAALKHQFVDRDGVMAAMVPWLRRPAEPVGGGDRGLVPVISGVAAIAALGLAAAALGRPEGAAPALPQTTRSPASSPVLVVTPGRAAAWTIDRKASTLGFSGQQSGQPFSGRFEGWDAQVWFDPADLAGSKAVVTIRTASARTGDATQEGSLGQAEWFDVGAFPTARFEVSEFRALGGDRFEAVGALKLKDRVTPVRLPFTFDAQDGAAKVAGTVRLDRTALGLGLLSDPGATLVSREIDVRIDILARRAPSG
ncbi:cytochrome b/b6 domain-containing protein [Phenylobacterium sp.]|jgi:cytochrome b561/polyisoprenoid-binding protein YceI|uniref:cytochrome b/b6 domain-containing protein n=1 Tax=Phenylobacterium sp. TaxID=1871053 RepID=UPI003782FDCA